MTNSSAAKLLHVAAGIVGGPRDLASRLGIVESQLRKFMAGTVPLPDALLLKAVDIVLADQHARLADAVAPAERPAREIPT